MKKNLIKYIVRYIFPYNNTIGGKIYLKYKFFHYLYNKNLKGIANYLSYRLYKKYHCIIHPSAQIGKKLILPHPIGIVIGAGSVIGDNCWIFQNVTIGRKNKDIEGCPNIGDNVVIYCNSVLIGDIHIGNDVTIGCNSTVLRNVDSNSTVGGIVK